MDEIFFWQSIDMRLSSLVIAPVFVLATTPLVSAQSRVAPSLVPFDVSAKRLSARFKGCDPVTLFAKLQPIAAKLQKSEFETSNEYVDRRSALLPAVLEGRTKTDSVIACTVRLRESEVSYSADREALDVKFDLLPFVAQESRVQLFSFRLALSQVGETKTLLGRNAFGVTRLVKNARYREYLLTLNNPDDVSPAPSWNSTAPYRTVEMSATLPPNAARVVKPRVAVAVVFVPSLPLSRTEEERESATLDSPINSVTERRLIFGTVCSLWLYDSETGDVLTRGKSTNAEGCPTTADSPDMVHPLVATPSP